MDNTNYLNLDLRALNTFLIIMETGSITTTANQLNVTQSAVSHGLDKLRSIFQDELFLRAGRGIKPTPRAQQLFEELRPLMANMKTLTEVTEFEPASANIHWTVAANDFQRDVVLPDFYQRVAKQVNHFSMDIIPSDIPEVSLLRDAVADIAISPIPPDAPDILQKRLFSSEVSCFYDETSRSAPESVEDFLQAKYVSLIFMAGKQLINDDNRIADGIEKNIHIRVSNFAGLPSFLRNSDMLVVGPTLMKSNLLAEFATAPLPFPSAELSMYLLWHQRYQNDAKHMWMRSELIESCSLSTE